MELADPRLARIVKQCQDLPGHELFQYMDESGVRCSIDSADVNRYIHDVARQGFTAKDFRTWAGTLLAARELYAAGPCRTEKERKKRIVEAVKEVARQLGNRPATCRKYYIHPAILDAYANGFLFTTMKAGAEQQAAYGRSGLRPEEYSVMVIIADHQERLAREVAAKSSGSHRSAQQASRPTRRHNLRLATVKKSAWRGDHFPNMGKSCRSSASLG